MLKTAVACVLVLCFATSARAVDWPQWGFGPGKSGVNDQETTIHSGNVTSLHLLYRVALPAIPDGAPAFLAGVTTAQGVKDLLFLTTKSGMLLAVDAATGSVVWSKQPATGPNYTTSSPAIDPSRQYVYSYGLEGKAHKYAVADGTEVTTGGWPELATNKPSVEKGSSALAIATAKSGATYLYVANGGYPGDAGDYQGHVTAVDLATGAQKIFNTQCSNQTVHFVIAPGTPDCAEVQTAIWARPGVVYDADNDRILMSTGNGTFAPATFGWGDTAFSLNPDVTGSGSGLPVDSYTPTNFLALQNGDADLGSTAPAVLPAVPASLHPHMAVQSGKDAMIRLLDRDNLSGQGGPSHTGGELQILAVPQGSVVLTQPAVWRNPADQSVWVFVANGSGISGLQLAVDPSGTPSLVSRWTNASGGSSPVLANGILYYAGSGAIRALNPTTGTTLWSDTTNVGGIHWESPIVVQGRVYLTDESTRLEAWVPVPGNTQLTTLTPCRVLDTRGAGGPLSANGGARIVAVGGTCGVPADAVAVAANVTAVSPGATGSLQAGPGGVALSTSLLPFAAGRTRAIGTILLITGFPAGSAELVNLSSAPLDVVLDVSGYFR
jgi:outer membrane protein assembly factor BamB